MELHHDDPSLMVIGTVLVQSLGRVPLLAIGAVGLIAGDALAGLAYVIPPVVITAASAGASLLLLQSDAVWKRLGLLALALVLANARADRLYRPHFPADHVAAAPLRVPLTVQAVLTDDPEPNGERMRLSLDVERIDSGDGWSATQGQVLLTVQHLEDLWQGGDRLQALLTLRRPRNLGNPGEFNHEGHLARRGVYVTASAEDDSEFYHVGHVDSLSTGWLTRWRRGVAALFRRTLSEPEAGVLGALIVGTEGALARDLRTAFSRAGVSHVLSISGLHVALVAGAGYAIFRWLLARSRWLLLSLNVPKLATALSVIPVLLYAGIAGSNVATIRSVIMILVFVAAVLVDRQRHLIVSLAVAAILIVLWSPGAALDISFQLSFVAVLGLVWGMQRFWPWWKRWEEARLVRLRDWKARLWRPIAVYGVVSISALTATTPLTALHFNQVCLVAPLANAVVVPLLGSVAVGLGLLAALAYPICEPVAQLCTVIAGPVVGLGVWLVRIFSALPYASLRVVTPSGFELALLYAGLIALFRLSGRVRGVSLAVLAVLAFGDTAWWYADRYHRSAMRVTFLSVGQGDSAVVEFPGAEVMVIDGGGLRGDAFDMGERVIAPFLWSRKIGHVDYLVLSHPEWDHYGGFAFLSANFSPREFWSSGAFAPTEPFARLQQLLTDNGVQRVALHRGDQRQIGGVHAAVQSPPQQPEGLRVNDQSLVLSLAFGGTRVLFPGDIALRGEENLAASTDGSLASTILKVPHHGSDTSSSPRFLDAVAPRYAVVSAGFENRFRFPHEAVLQRYGDHGCRIARTDLDGAVHVRVNAGGEVEMVTQKSR
ncbi:MAG: DNA internalization-related competence protein ComEC/Rec2 [Candidatus Binatia bacterium]